MRKILLFFAAVAFASGAFLASCVAQAKPVSQSATIGSYQVTLKVLPAEAFTGADEKMAWDGGARPELVGSKSHPNHHLVVFVAKDGKPVENATVRIHYRALDTPTEHWKTLPVARMYVKGKSRGTMHYGNNVHLTPGNYAAKVQIGNSLAHAFHFTVSND
ncbi:MAG: hypothetical protein WCB49_01260 [Gammaproteobacteria bacterium]